MTEAMSIDESFPEPKKRGPAPYVETPHPPLAWYPDGGSGLLGMRMKTVFVRIAWMGSSYRIIPTFPLPRGTRVTGDAESDLERAKRKAEWFFEEWLNRTGLALAEDAMLPRRR